MNRRPGPTRFEEIVGTAEAERVGATLRDWEEGTPMPKTTKVDEAVAAAFAGVEYAEMAFRAFEFARMALPRHVASHDDPNLMAVRALLVANVGDAYRRLFMWTTVHVDDNVRQRAKELAMRRFLTQHHEIMSYLNPRGDMPGGWLDDDEKQFRDEIAALMDTEKTGVETGTAD